jgi:hypothetical protein
LRKFVFLSSLNKVLLSVDVINLASYVINAVMNDAEILLQFSTLHTLIWMYTDRTVCMNTERNRPAM